MTAKESSVDVALATALELEEPDFDLEPLRAALLAAGVRCAVLAWDDPRADFASAAVTVLRSTWNYQRVPDAFSSWIARTARASSLWNREAFVRWNLHKSYLFELAEAGVPITPTELVRRGAAPKLLELRRSRGWSSVVIKPAISAASMDTMLIHPQECDSGQEHLDRIADRGDVLVQEYLSSVESHGERALVWIDGAVTHAVRKAARFSGQDELTSEDAVEIGGHEAALARRAMAAACRRLGDEPLYGRVDLAPGPRGLPVVMELELIEPSLYLSRSVEALDRLVAAIRVRLDEVRSAPETG